MKIIFTRLLTPGFILLTAIVCSCNQPAPAQDADIPAPVNTPPPPEDSVITRLRPAVTAIESNNLQMGGYKLKYIRIDSIRYEMISMKTYCAERRAELEKNLHLSVDKEKTARVIRYLKDGAAKASANPDIYKVSFFMNAQAGETRYQERHSNYLKPDLSELRMDFRGL